ncbi:MAG TPA: DUF6748 domain-containing protein, partial [Kofleriaceae bacterium]|nr:DUF6748 domain-containing protein [Kofleriaceae bacterium]
AGESARDGEAGKADGSDNWSYFTIRPDIRRCVFPLCGGEYVQRVNRSYTYCRGSWTAGECYVSVMDWSRTGLGDDQIAGALNSGYPVLVRGWTDDAYYDGFGNYGKFVASELWVANNADAPDGVYARVKNNGVRCFTTPCNSISEGKLNSWLYGNIAEVDFSASSATEDELAKAYDAMAGNDGVMITGWRYWWREHNTWGAGRTAEQFFRRVVAAAPKCMVTGCSNQVCAPDPVVTTCEDLPQYACYATATCERQAGGECGWTETPELTACLEGSL